MKSNFISVAVGVALLLGVANPAAASSELLDTPTGGASMARADQLVSKAIASLSSSGWQRSRTQEELISYFLEAGRCNDALQMLADLDHSQARESPGPSMTVQTAERLATAARQADLKECAIAISRRWAALARAVKRIDQLAAAGAFLRTVGNDDEGTALIAEAEAEVRGPLTRTSYLWSMRRQELQLYAGTDLVVPELERSAQQLLAAAPSEDERQVQPAAGWLAGMLFENGNDTLARLVAESDCVRGPNRTIPCGTGGRLDRDLDRLSAKIASGLPTEQNAAMNMLYRNGAIDRIAPHFPRMVEIQEGNRAAAFRMLAFYSHTLWPTEPQIAEMGAHQALALALKRPDEAAGLDPVVWHVSNAHLAKIFAGAGDDRAVKEILRRAKPKGEERELYFTEIASGYARFGDQAAVQDYIDAIADDQAQRRAWWAIAVGTPGVRIENRLRAAERARSILFVPDPKAGYGYVGPPPGVVNCGELAGAAMIASEGAPFEAIMRFAQYSEEQSAHGTCAYRRFLLNAAEGIEKDERSKQIALELLRTTDRPCTGMSCDDLKVLQLLVNLELYDEAEQLTEMFDEPDRTGPLITIARGMITRNRRTTASR